MFRWQPGGRESRVLRALPAGALLLFDLGYTNFHQGQATDLVTYLALNADWLGILKRPRASKPPPLLVVRKLTVAPDP